jgi:chromosome segregation ATPase
MKFLGYLAAYAAAAALFVAFVGTPALYVAGGLAVLIGLGLTVPSPFRENLRLGLGIRLGAAVDSLASDAERAEARVNKLAADIKENERKVSDLRGTLNHEKNVLKRTESELDAAIADYDLAEDAANREPGNAGLQQMVAEQLDKVEQARQAVDTQKEVVGTHQEAADAAREAIALASREIRSLQTKVRSAQAKEKAAGSLRSAATVLETTKDLANRSTGLGKDLDKVDEKFEQAKEHLRSAQGSDSDRRLAEIKAKRQQGDTAEWLKNRRAGNNGQQ